jgi:hypothetical protein
MAALTAPFDPAWSSRLGGALTVLTTVQVTGAGITPITLDVISGTVTWAEDSTPHVLATMQCRVPDDQATLDAIDARLPRRLVITGGYRVPGVSETRTIADLMLTGRIVSRPDNTMTVTAVSDEQRIIDTQPIGASQSFTETSDGGAAIKSLITWAVSGTAAASASYDVTTSGLFVASGDTLLIDREDQFWSSIQDIADRIGAWVYHDGLGTFHAVPQPTSAGSAVAMLNAGTGGTVTASEAALDRTDWANTVVVQYEWYDGESHTAFGYAEVTTGPYAVATVGRKVKRVVIERKGTAAQAKAAAASMLRRAITRGRSLSVEVEHFPMWVRPGSTVTVTLPTGPQERHLVSRVDLDIPSGRGHITTRQPENVTITTGE